MKENKNKSIPVFAEGGELEGLITVGDIAKSYMDMYGRNLLSEAKTQYKSIAETLDGELVIGDGEGYFEKGKVGIGASNPEPMEYFIEPGDLITSATVTRLSSVRLRWRQAVLLCVRILKYPRRSVSWLLKKDV